MSLLGGLADGLLRCDAVSVLDEKSSGLDSGFESGPTGAGRLFKVES